MGWQRGFIKDSFFIYFLVFILYFKESQIKVEENSKRFPMEM